MDLALDERNERRCARNVSGKDDRLDGQRRCGQKKVGRPDEDGIERGHHALRVLDVRGFAPLDQRKGLERCVRLGVPVGDQSVVPPLVHGVVHVRPRSQWEQTQRGDEDGARATDEYH